ncbi:MAG: hypothetical protein ABI624_13220 [Casimicrobiaceae bacterium]
MIIKFASKLAPRAVLLSRVIASTLVAFAMLIGTLLLGMGGYHWIEDFAWLDAFHQSAMLLAGMGPVKEIDTTAGKWFDSLYALFCALMLLGSGGVLFSPLFHRILHKFHLEDAGSEK